MADMQTANTQVENTSLDDVESIFQLFEQSIEYQEKKGYPVWRNYDRNAIIKDIENGNQYKIVLDSKIAIVFSVAYVDRIIWRHRDKADAVYLHRIVVNPACKGQRLFGKILDWSVEHAGRKGLQYVRMDTWAANPNIVEYYKTFGFHVVENYTTPDSTELPIHNRNLALTLLQFKI